MAPRNPQPEPTNLTEYSVSELAFALKRTVEDAYGLVRLRGEVSGYRGPHASGHCYFTLKDEKAVIEAVVWRGVFGRLKFKPEEGLEVVAKGKITTFPGGSKYQIVIEELEPAGAGALMALLEQRKKQLAAEGLFDEERKQALPFLPRVIGVVTSPTGAVIRDILHRLSDRFPSHVIVWPVRVQGETCAAEVAAAIAGFNAAATADGMPRPDLIIVARGGGSLEDLWGFNEETRGARRGGERDPSDLRRGSRDRLDLDRSRGRLPRADPDGSGRARGAGSLRTAEHGAYKRSRAWPAPCAGRWNIGAAASPHRRAGCLAAKPFWACHANGSIRRAGVCSSP